MPRPKKNTAEPVFYSRPPELSSEAESGLRKSLGLDGTQHDNKWMPVKADIQSALALLTEAQSHLDNMPRAAHYKVEFKSAHASAAKLEKQITGWSTYYRDAADLEEPDTSPSESFDLDKVTLTGELIAVLQRFIAASDRVLESTENESSKGAPKNFALNSCIGSLRCTFAKHSSGQAAKRKKQGAFTTLSPSEKNELEFVMAALKDVRAVKKTFSEQALRQIFLKLDRNK